MTKRLDCPWGAGEGLAQEGEVWYKGGMVKQNPWRPPPLPVPTEAGPELGEVEVTPISANIPLFQQRVTVLPQHLEPLQQVPASLLSGLSFVQIQFLAQIWRYPSKVALCKALNMSPVTAERWRRNLQYRAAEDAVLGRAAQFVYQSAASEILRKASAEVALGQVELATAPAKSDRALTAKQRASETVLRAAGVLSEAANGGAAPQETYTMIVRRLWDGRRAAETVEVARTVTAPVLPATGGGQAGANDEDEGGNGKQQGEGGDGFDR